ncbi:MAG: mechanosensitive ion channel, partial [Helicobacter sp.]|nr:mechanosensitive ion channel [Helicobacter sp.]
MRFVIFYLLGIGLLLANTSAQNNAAIMLSQNKILLSLASIDRYLSDSSNVWSKQYANYKTYLDVVRSLQNAEEELNNIKKSPQSQVQRSMLEREIETLKQQKDLLANFKDNPYAELISPTIEERNFHVSNPILIIQGVSYIKQLRAESKRLNSNFKALKSLNEQLKEKAKLLKELQELGSADDILGGGRTIAEELQTTHAMLEDLVSTSQVFATTLDLFQNKAEDEIGQITAEITDQVIKAAIVAMIVLLSILIAFMLKLGIRRYITSNERSYTMSKIVNYINIIIIVLIVLFSYLENVTYLVAFLGFASAGLAIAMKDLFMSVLGWFVIVVGGSVHVGDRIRVVKDGAIYIGDVLDISLLRITIHEGITLLTYMENRRAGRIIFIPNNYIFTTMIANYTHGSMKTVWDGIDITITFDSNHKKMVQICTDIAKHYAKGYTDITRKQLNLLRDRYSLRNTNVEPRVFTMIEANGIRVSLWYQTNAYATLPLHSTICGEIIDAIKHEDDITIAYPTTTIRAPKDAPPSDGIVPPT